MYYCQESAAQLYVLSEYALSLLCVDICRGHNKGCDCWLIVCTLTLTVCDVDDSQTRFNPFTAPQSIHFPD